MGEVTEVSGNLEMMEAVKELSAEEFISLITVVYCTGFCDVYDRAELPDETQAEQRARLTCLVKSWLEI